MVYSMFWFGTQRIFKHRNIVLFCQIERPSSWREHLITLNKTTVHISVFLS